MQAPAFLAPIVLIFLAAMASAYVLHRIHQPPLIGFLLAGVLLGPFGLGLENDVAAVDALAQIGVILLLFTVGLELELPNLKRLGKIVWLAGPVQVVGTTALVTAIGSLAGYDLRRSIFFGFLVALSSTAIVLTLLIDRREMDSPHGKLLLGILIFQDLAVVPMMLGVPALAGAGTVAGGVGLPLTLVALGKTAATAILLFLAARFVVPRLLHLLAGTQKKALFVVAVLFILFGTSLAAVAAGISAALGAFLAGLVISESDYGHQAMADVAPFRDAFQALFFVSIGMLFDPGILVTDAAPVIELVALIVLGKTIFGALPVLLFGYGPRVATVVGVSLAQIGEFSFVLLSVGKAASLISPRLYQMFLGAAIVSMAATPFLSDKSHALATRLARSVGSKPSPPAGAPAAGRVLVFGFGLMGETISRVLARANVPFQVLDLNPERVEKGRAKGLPVHYGDTTSDLVLKAAGIETARAVIVLLSDPRATRQSLRLCRQLAPKVFLLVRTRYLADLPELSALGADEVVAEEFETSFEISRRTLEALGLPVPWLEDEAATKRHAQEDAFRRLPEPGAP